MSEQNNSINFKTVAVCLISVILVLSLSANYRQHTELESLQKENDYLRRFPQFSTEWVGEKLYSFVVVEGEVRFISENSTEARQYWLESIEYYEAWLHAKQD